MSLNIWCHYLKLLFFIFLILVIVSCEKSDNEVTNSAYITDVFEYQYAPGQHANTVKPADAANFISLPSNIKSCLYLGGWGGYVIAGFDHNVINHEGYDFEVFALAGVSPEPAIVYVMEDKNGDGKPNDIWYELKGNQFENSKRNYWVCYYKAFSDSANITWKDSEGNTGELLAGFGTKYTASWWWKYYENDSITFYGTRLPDAYENNSTQWVVPVDRFTWGYAENNFGIDYDQIVHSNQFDISNAVDSLGNSIDLLHIRFIKIQTGVFQQAGWLNEISSEICGARELK
ncbi:MAG TPA: hypothetical protein P5071_03190 [Paludibacteraceae bacterium]|nr:hypothetical protein [Paludibacteraceae bacterium]HRU63478.1 hypothetical protein [Paludibacteraceae bacterium]